jgi:hypothetical protein
MVMLKQVAEAVEAVAPPQPDVDEPAAGGACNEYRVDLAGANFGDCKCGFPKSAHAASAMKRGPSAVASAKKMM